MITGNESAMPFTYVDPNNGAPMVEHGLSIRQQFAMVADVDIDDYSVSSGEKILGREVNYKDAVENIKWWIDFEAAIKVMKADALIKALNE